MIDVKEAKDKGSGGGALDWLHSQLTEHWKRSVAVSAGSVALYLALTGTGAVEVHWNPANWSMFGGNDKQEQPAPKVDGSGAEGSGSAPSCRLHLTSPEEAQANPDDTYDWQVFLQSRTAYPDNAKALDRLYGPQTITATKEFQRGHTLPETGFVDATTCLTAGQEDPNLLVSASG